MNQEQSSRQSGSVYSRSVDGRWYGALDVGSLDGRRRRITVSGRDRDHVKLRLARLRRRLAAQSVELTVGEFLRRWFSEMLPGTVGSPNTLDNYRWAIEGHLVPGLGMHLLVDLAPEDVASFLDDRLGSGLAVRSVARLRTVLSTALSHAVATGLVARNVARLTRPPKGTVRAGRSLTFAQARTLLRASAGTRFDAAFVLMLTLGLRVGEVLGLRWEDVDLEEATLAITSTLHRGVHGHWLGPTKTPQSRRSLALPAPVVAVLHARCSAQVAERQKAGPRWREQGFVFTTRTGGPIDHSCIREHLVRLSAEADIGRWHPHALRHTAVSLLSAAGLRLEDIADVVGHRSTRTTSAVYRHVVVPRIDAAVEPVERLFAVPV